MRKIYLLASLVAFSGAVFTSGCGDDAPSVTRSRVTKKAKKATKSSGAPTLDLSNLPEKLRKADWSAPTRVNQNQELRDPFMPSVGDLLGVKPEDNDERGGKKDDNRKKSNVYLSNFEVQEMALIGIITGGAVNKAMLTDPSGVGHIVRTGQVVGRTPMRVSRITRNEVVFRPLSNDKNAGKEVQKVLLSQEELAEVLP
ncbi:pilus assembly protein PilP [Myxococcota bacterium]|nr:pilus assembly protein PilP [Myxococcota bacterium]MBU1429340.1 pilus assembly protein PilP [Myxococcota bacterium]MBU1898945.1 pilus assembly protein PilP [Myxococcota bacterium]